MNDYKLLVCWYEEDEKEKSMGWQASGCGQSCEFERSGRIWSGTVSVTRETQMSTGMASEIVS